jgi:hypothetical protein
VIEIQTWKMHQTKSWVHEKLKEGILRTFTEAGGSASSN